MISFLCSGCGAQLKVKEDGVGRAGRCPICGQRIRSPGPSGTSLSGTIKSPARMAAGVRAEPSSVAEDIPPAEASSAPGSNDAQPVFQRQTSVAEVDYAFLAPPEGPDELGRLSYYRILKVLGVGGMGIVFQAEDTRLKRMVALKAMKPAVAAKETSRSRFHREAVAIGRIESDHIVHIYDVGEDRGIPFLAMKLLQGESLDERMKREGGWLPLPEVLRIGREVCEGLDAAHEAGLIHRDIKPANIWLESPTGRVKIVDFGLARIVKEDGQLTQEGTLMGTPAYMAPEQASGDPIDNRADLFSVGCVLYRMSTGQLPFKGKDTMSMLMALASQTPERLRTIDPDLPQEFDDLVARILSKDPDGRPRSAHEIAETLEVIQRNLRDAARRTEPARTAEPRREVPVPPPVRPFFADEPEAAPPPPKRATQEPPARASTPLESQEAEDTLTAGRDAERHAAARRRRHREALDQAEVERKVIRWAIIVGALLFLLVLYLLVLRPIIYHFTHSERPASTARP